LLVTELPQPDELLSSWVYRLAWRNGIKTHTLTKRFWQHPGVPWGGDGDLRVGVDDLERLATLARQPLEAVWRSSLQSYEGILFDDGVRAPAGIAYLGGRGKQRTRFGLAICPECLAEDEVPYFRRHWRVSCVVSCQVHQRLLLDACPGCDRGITLTSTDQGSSRLGDRQDGTACRHCRFDWRTASRDRNQVSLEADFWTLQSHLNNSLSDTWTTSPAGDPVMTMALFRGVRYVLRALAGGGQNMRLANAVAPQLGMLPLPVRSFDEKHDFDGYRLCDRAYLLRQAAWVLKDWPERFVWAAKSTRTRPSYLDTYRGDVPLWLERGLDQCRSREHYPMSSEEWRSAAEYLRRRGLEGNDFQVRKLSGRHPTPSNHRLDPAFLPGWPIE